MDDMLKVVILVGSLVGLGVGPTPESRWSGLISPSGSLPISMTQSACPLDSHSITNRRGSWI